MTEPPPSDGTPEERTGVPTRCYCLFNHAITEQERAEVRKQIDYARRIGDTRGLLVHLTRLTGECPARRNS
ncbi:hypothetical protein ACQPZ8_01290 [Actinomadura nitritigenes]|uniref:hypothetical protein n=1 Tax=Actinomadura nitritigenes TaxID=134602 RepID=UPI003D906C7C